MDLMCVVDQNGGLYVRANSEQELVEALEKTLERLGRDWRSRVRCAVAANDAPPHLLARLARDWSPAVRERVAASTATPAGLLTRLARDRSSRVLLALVGNPETPDAALAETGRRLGGRGVHVMSALGLGVTGTLAVRRALARRRPPAAQR